MITNILLGLILIVMCFIAIMVWALGEHMEEKYKK